MSTSERLSALARSEAENESGERKSSHNNFEKISNYENARARPRSPALPRDHAKID